jgi:hypothetical protein
LSSKLQSSTSAFPHDKDLRNPMIAKILSTVLSTGSIVVEDDGDEDPNLMQCHRNGWLHADNLSGDGNEKGYVLPSPLHRWYLEWMLSPSGEGVWKEDIHRCSGKTIRGGAEPWTFGHLQSHGT